QPLGYDGLEHLTLREFDDHVEINSVVIGVEDQIPFRLDYHLKCDQSYRLRELLINVTDVGKLKITSDGHGKWFDGEGQQLPELDTCLDIDISATPFTNMLPINRIKWQPGQTETINVVYILIPDLEVSVEKQRYTYMSKEDERSIYRFEHLSSGFTALLSVDKDGIVLDYPDLFEAIWSKPVGDSDIDPK
ncbi:MAG: putative glycolipid-binding domain-containing protein, partial [Chitinophagaceae bacterium]|nr:putative glycolipid-binding domain-containing protein [Anaerolineae bacterium]